MEQVSSSHKGTFIHRRTDWR